MDNDQLLNQIQTLLDGMEKRVNIRFDTAGHETEQAKRDLIQRLTARVDVCTGLMEKLVPSFIDYMRDAGRLVGNPISVPFGTGSLDIVVLGKSAGPVKPTAETKLVSEMWVALKLAISHLDGAYSGLEDLERSLESTILKADQFLASGDPKSEDSNG
jgi:hypothetical protein